MNLSKKEKVSLLAVMLGILGFLLIFFCVAHPLVIFDTDDWTTIAINRLPFPLWKYWNPTRILPETLAPLLARFAAFVVYPFTHQYIMSMAWVFGVFYAALITLYVYVFYRFLRIRLGTAFPTALISSVLFLILHFAVFCVYSDNNIHLFHSCNVTCIFYYSIPMLLNAILVMWLECIYFDSAPKKNNGIQSSILFALIYFAVFSNILCSYLLSAWAGSRILLFLVREFRQHPRKIKFFDFLKENSWPLYILALWFISAFFEFFGGRASSLDTSPFSLSAYLANIPSFIKKYLQILLSLNSICKYCFLIVFLIGAAALFLKRKSCSNELSVLLTFAITLSASLIYLLLLGSFLAGYISRTEVLLGLFFQGYLILFTLFTHLLKSFPGLQIGCPLFVCLLFLCILPTGKEYGGKVFTDINMVGYRWQTSLEFDNYIVDTILEASKTHEDEVTFIFPTYDYFDNFPLSTCRVYSDILCRHGLVPHALKENFILSDTRKKDFGMK